MSAQPLRALIWKDMRLNRPVSIFAGLSIVCSYLVSFGIEVRRHCDAAYQGSYNRVWDSSIGLLLPFAALATALVAANVVAGEYADRSAGFLAYQPPSRRMVLLSKVISGLIPVLILVAVCLVTILFAEYDTRDRTFFWDKFLRLATYLLGSAWVIFAGSWCVAAISQSVAIGVVGGISVPGFLFVALADSQLDERYRALVFCLAAAVIGALLFVAATIILLRRRET